MTDVPLVTIEKRRLAALIDAARLARYALLRTNRRFDCPPHDPHSLAHTIDLAITNAKEVQP